MKEFNFMGIDAFTKNDRNIITKPDITAKENFEIQPTLEKRRWDYADEEIKISLSADKVACIETDGKTEVCDEFVWQSRIDKIFDAVKKSVTSDKSKYCPPPKAVEIYFKNSAEPEEKFIDDKKIYQVENESIVIREPRWSFEDMYIDDKIFDEVQRTLLIAKHREKLFGEWKLGNGETSGRAIVFNFYGPSGTGKSMTAEAIAKNLGKKIYSVNYSELESKYVGETPKNIVAAFRKAQAEDAVLVFDEADSFLGKRLTNVTQSADYGVNITRSVMLLELEKFDGIVIFTTNLVTNYDEAFKRRILTSIKFDLPDESARQKIWQIYLNRGLPLSEEITAEKLATDFENISGADIKDMLLHAAVSAIYRDENNPVLSEEDFNSAYKMILSRRTNSNFGTEVKITNETISAEQYKSETGEWID